MPINRTPYNALVDDDGTNTVGSLWSKTAIKTVILDPVDLAFGPLTQTTTLTGNQNDFVLSTGSMMVTLRCNNPGDLTITGFLAGVDGQRLRVVAVGAGNVYLSPQNVLSAAANRLLNMCFSAGTPLAAGIGVAEYTYDGTSARWRLVAHEQGAAIAYPVVWTGQTTNPALGNGTLAGAYLLHGRLIDVALNLNLGSTTTLGSGLWLFSLPIPMSGTPPCGSGFVSSSAGAVTAMMVTTITAFLHAGGDLVGFLTSNGASVGSGTPAGMTANDTYRASVLNVPVA